MLNACDYTFREFRPSEMNSDLWPAFYGLRDSDASKDDPLFDPYLVDLIGRVRRDTFIQIAFYKNNPNGFWPLHRRSSNWTRPIAGPFSDWYGPITNSAFQLSSADFLRGADVAGMTVFGLQPQSWAAPTQGLCRDAAFAALIETDTQAYFDVQTQMFPAHFKKMRRVFRKLEREHSEVHFEFDDLSPEAFHWVIAQKKKFHQSGRHDVLGAPWAQRFLDRAWLSPSPDFRLNLSTLRIDGKIAAAELNMCSVSTIHGWLVAYNPDFANLAPGLILLHRIVEHMEQNGFLKYDLGAGHYHYKKAYSNISFPVDSGVLRTEKHVSHPDRLVARAWSQFENRAPDELANVLGKVRRRTDQIVITELDLPRRARGMLQALNR